MNMKPAPIWRTWSRRVPLLLPTVLVLAACGPAETPSTSATPVSVTPASQPVVVTTIVTSDANTSMPGTTPLSAATATAEESDRSTAASDASDSGLPLPTLAILPPGVSNTYESEPSPDGRWLVRHLVHDKTRTMLFEDGSRELAFIYHSQHLATVDGSITHTIRSEWIADGLGVDWPLFVGWDPASGAAYVGMGGVSDGCDMNGWSGPISRVAVSDGSRREIGGVAGTARLSPDGSRIGGIRPVEGHQVELVWVETGSGEERQPPRTDLETTTSAWVKSEDGEVLGLRFGIPYEDNPIFSGHVAPPIWSPDALAVLVPFHYEPCSDRWRNRLVYVDLRTGEARIIWEPDADLGRVDFEAWTEDDLVAFVARRHGWANEQEPGVRLQFDTNALEWRER